MAELKQFDLDFSGDFLDTTTPAKPVPKELIPDKKREPVIETTKNKTEGYDFEPVTNGVVTDYSPFPANRIYIANEKTILKSGAPPWIPPFDQEFMRANAYLYIAYKRKDIPIIAKIVIIIAIIYALSLIDCPDIFYT
jgi:hypothetical protein